MARIETGSPSRLIRLTRQDQGERIRKPTDGGEGPRSGVHIRALGGCFYLCLFMSIPTYAYISQTALVIFLQSCHILLPYDRTKN